mgnify:CR=1 FL=1
MLKSPVPYGLAIHARLKRDLLLGMIATCALLYAWMFTQGAPNERSRVYLSVALIDQGTVHIDESLRRFGYTFDLATHGNHFYTDKAPGSSFLGALVYGALRIFSSPEDWSIHALIQWMRWGLMIPITLIGFFILRDLLRTLNIQEPIIDISSLAWLFGSAAFHYGRAFYGHQIVAICLLSALWLVFPAPRHRMRLRWCAAGMLCGFATLTEYQAAIPCIVFAGFGLWQAYRCNALRTWWLFCLGTLPSVIAFCLYHHTAFGGVFELSYHHLVNEQTRQLHSQGIGGVLFPQWKFLGGLLFSLHRGLITTSPWVLFAIVGLRAYFRDTSKEYRGTAWLMLLVLVYFIVFTSSSNMWFAGWSFGPRLLVPVLPWLSVLAAFGMQHAWHHATTRALALGSVTISIVYYQLVNITFAELPPEANNPILDTVMPLLQGHQLIPNWSWQLTGRGDAWSTLPFALLISAVLVWIFRQGLVGISYSKWKITCGAMACVVPLILAIVIRGPAWDETQRSKFVQDVQIWSYEG